MRVFSLWGEVTTNPFPASNGVIFQLRGGDVCHPWGSENWFDPPYFSGGIWRTYFRWCVLPYFAYRWDWIGKQGYIGFKAYGADSPAYKNWMNPDDVYPGSVAMHMSVRPFARIEK